MPVVNRIFVHPCGLSAHREPHELVTVLGSCIAICLWDRGAQIGGMNHFMLPLWNGDGLPTPKFGNVALEHLEKRLLTLGTSSDRLVAKVFGGANVVGELGRSLKIGDRNAQIALDLLERRNIPVVAKDLGGVRARKIIFNTATGVVLVGQLQLDSNLAKVLPDGRPRG